jgi:hypothetical protein
MSPPLLMGDRENAVAAGAALAFFASVMEGLEFARK